MVMMKIQETETETARAESVVELLFIKQNLEGLAWKSFLLHGCIPMMMMIRTRLIGLPVEAASEGARVEIKLLREDEDKDEDEGFIEMPLLVFTSVALSKATSPASHRLSERSELNGLQRKGTGGPD
ncbi:uncharacterized protein G2W53_038626 [Senna tora]|uniref:Uncharacterized protein n=1 Tax=Senna tora TaxID=362788 RepID=A0A834W279_9FABA|nr:uncharacterized protein G2W53_038626 [Senna tora]